jgi:hypothetical protein
MHVKMKGLALVGAVCGILAVASPLLAGDGHCCGTPDGCGKSVCVPSSEVKTVKKSFYSDAPEEFCLPYSTLTLIFGKCDCSKVKHRKDMILKVRPVCECCVKRCYPSCQPACGGCSGCATPAVPAGAAPGLPAPMPKTAGTISVQPVVAPGTSVIVVEPVPQR